MCQTFFLGDSESPVQMKGVVLIRIDCIWKVGHRIKDQNSHTYGNTHLFLQGLCRNTDIFAEPWLFLVCKFMVEVERKHLIYDEKR